MRHPGSGNTIAIGCFALALTVGLGGSLLLYGFYKNNDLQKPTGGYVSSEGGCISPLLPPINDPAKLASSIDSYIRSLEPRSPLAGLGKTFVESGTNSGVNPAFIVSIARKESSLGTDGWAAQNANNPFGRTASSSQPSKVSPTGRHWYSFQSFEEAVREEGPYLKRVYIAEGLTTIDAIIGKYAPPSENNTAAYISEMKKWIGEVVAASEGSFNCGSPNSSIASDSTHPIAGSTVGQCINARSIPKLIPAKNNRLAQTVLVSKLEQLWEKNKTWRVTEACPPTSTHQSVNHYNGRAVDIAIFPQGEATPQKIDQLLSDIKAVGFSYVLDEYRVNTENKTGGHIHLEWRGR
jgi:hypothetical protein